MSLLEVKGLKKVYKTRFGGHAVEALKNVNFTVEEGEYVAIMGESGSGKTTLLNILAGQAHLRIGAAGWKGFLKDQRERRGDVSPGQPGLRVPGVQPAGHIHAGGQHLPAAGAGREELA